MRLDLLSSPLGNITIRPTTTRSGAVRQTADISRVVNLPTKGDVSDISAKVRQLCEHASGVTTLRNIQLEALTQAALAASLEGPPKGVFCPIAVGGGKTLIAALLPLVFDAHRPLVLTTRGLIQTSTDQLRTHMRSFRIPSHTRWVSYGVLSSPKRSSLLDDYMPDLVIADECQYLANPQSTRTRRFLRFFKEHPHVRFCALSGTMMRESVMDFAHLLTLALRDYAPIPPKWVDQQEWAEALDPPTGGEQRRPPGALMSFCRRGEDVVSGYERRLNTSLGVVASTTNPIDVPLRVQHVVVPYTQAIQAHIKELSNTWRTPGGEELTCALAYQRAYHQLRLGGYYYWDWPGEPDHEWLQARAEYNKEMRYFLAHRSRKGLDSPSLVEREVREGRILFQAWPAWDSVRHRPKPPTAWAWVDDCVVRWAAEHVRPKTIVWSMVGAFGRRVADVAGCPYYGAGDAASVGIEAEKGEQGVVASVRAHGVGRNLQRAFSRNLVCAAVGSARDWEQLIGRTHRPGQTSEVSVLVPDIFLNEWERALKKADYLQTLLGNEQKIVWLRRT